MAFDAGLPTPLRLYRLGRGAADSVPQLLDVRWQVREMMDQHAFLQLPPDHGLRVGDVIAFGASHPCLTFDKWRSVCLVDEDLQLLEAMPTYF